MTYKVTIATLVGWIALSMIWANESQGSTLYRTRGDTYIEDGSDMHHAHERLAEDNDIVDVIKEMTEGVDTLGLVLMRIRDSAKNIRDPINEALKQTVIIASKKGRPIVVDEDNVSAEAIQEFLHVKNNLRMSQGDLFSMADKTVKACEEIIIYMDGWDSDVDAEDQKIYLQEQLNSIKILLETAKSTLEKTKLTYDDSIVQLDAFESRLHSFVGQLEDMLDDNSSSHKNWSENVQLEIYSRMENCSTENSTTGEKSKDQSETLQSKVNEVLEIIKQKVFPQACPDDAIKAEISRIEAKLEDIKGTVQSAGNAVRSTKGALNELRSFLRTKLQIITKWIIGANKLHETTEVASDDAFRQLVQLRTEFQASVDRLATEAEALIQMHQ